MYLMSIAKGQSSVTDASGLLGPRWYESTCFLGLSGAFLLWLSAPPVDWGFLAWIAPICWLLLIRGSLLAGWRPFLTLYLVGWIYFGATFYWIMLPHALAILGWLALSSYLAFYVLAFVGLCRVAVHRLHIPLVLTAPVVWTGLEIIRAHLLTGFLMAALGHTQYRWLSVIQLSDLVGAYGVSFLIMFVAASLARALPFRGKKFTFWPLLPAGLAILVSVMYGQIRLQHEVLEQGPRIALIQGSIDTEFDVDPEQSNRRIEKQYLQLTRDVLKEHADIDLVIWPESMCTIPLITIDEGAWLPANVLVQWFMQEPEEARHLEEVRKLPTQIYQYAKYNQVRFGQLVQQLAATQAERHAAMPRLLLGVNSQHYGAGYMKSFNSSVYLGDAGETLGRYDKMHLVMFGEYIPLGDIFPALYRFTPLADGLTPGKEAVIYDVDGYRLTPSICYETVLPHVIRRQLLMHEQGGTPADVLVSQTNDGWFWGSAALDMHMICGIFRTIECRKPLLIAANTGFSASINSDGLVEDRGDRRTVDTLVVHPRIDRRESFYLYAGDWFAWLCAACSVGLLLFALFEKIGRGRFGENV